jgi:hypothetical protein
VSDESGLRLSDDGRPGYDVNHGGRLAALRLPGVRLHARYIPRVVVAALRRDDIAAWAAARDIALVRRRGEKFRGLGRLTRAMGWATLGAGLDMGAEMDDSIEKLWSMPEPAPSGRTPMPAAGTWKRSLRATHSGHGSSG